MRSHAKEATPSSSDPLAVPILNPSTNPGILNPLQAYAELEKQGMNVRRRRKL
jgi:hypothetical protein